MSKVGLPGLVTQLLQDGVAVARAEVQLFKARLGVRLAAARTGLILFAAAGVVALVSLIGLVTGLVMALAPLVGPAVAGLIILVVGLLIAGVLGWIGAIQISTKPEALIETLPALEDKS